MMPRAPDFWRHGGGRVLPALLAPLAAITARVTARRVARPGFTAGVPVICCGNVTSGGAGKTTLALALGRRLVERGVAAHFLLRGYGGTARGTMRVDADAPVGLVGDEALLLARVAPTWIGADRAASAREAVAAGAAALVMDDGLQNPTLVKNLSFLVVDGATGFGNGHVLPAGPLREPIAVGAARCQAAVLIGEDRTGAAARLPATLPVLRARLRPGAEVAALARRRVVAFAGIAIPEKFFTSLAEAGVEVTERHPFPDHYRFSEEELDALAERADRRRAVLLTTAKDAVRLPPVFRPRVRVASVSLEFEDEAALDALLDQALRSVG